MSQIPNPFSLLAKAARAFFVADLKLQRSKHGLAVVLDDKAASAAEPATGGKGRAGRLETEREQRELRQMRASLATLLDENAATRSALKQLAYMDHALDKVGLRALHKVPYDVLKRAHGQLEGLVINWSDAGLAALRSKMAVALIEREPPAAAAPAAADTAQAVDSQAPLAHPEPLEGEEAAEAEAALLAAYGAVALPGLTLAPVETPAAAAVEVQGELGSPSGQALARATRRAEPARAAEPATH